MKLFTAFTFLLNLIFADTTTSGPDLKQSLVAPTSAVTSDEIVHLVFDTTKALTPAEIEKVAGRAGACKYKGRVGIGVNSTRLPNGAVSPELIKVREAVKNNPCAALHIYDQGPGGETGNKGYQKDEIAEIQRIASGCGLKVPANQKSPEFKKAMSSYFASGCYLKQVRHKNMMACQNGAKSIEYDNQENDPRMGHHVQNGLIQFVKQFEFMNPCGLKLVLKNRSKRQLEGLKAAIDKGIIKPTTLANITVTEESIKDKPAIAQASAQLGAKPICTVNTNAYRGSSINNPCEAPAEKPTKVAAVVQNGDRAPASIPEKTE